MDIPEVIIEGARQLLDQQLKYLVQNYLIRNQFRNYEPAQVKELGFIYEGVGRR